MSFQQLSRRRALAGALLCALSITAPLALAQNKDKDMAEIQHYTLTMDKVTRFMQVFGDLRDAAKADPELSKSLETDADKNQDLAAMTQRVSSSPAIVGALGKRGLAPHEFCVLEVALLQAGFAASMKPADKTNAQYAAEVQMNPANLAFVQDHKAELDALQAKYPMQ